MSLPKILVSGALTLFLVIGVAAYIKKSPERGLSTGAMEARESKPLTLLPETPVVSVKIKQEEKQLPKPDKKRKQAKLEFSSLDQKPLVPATKDDFPMIDRIFQLFTTGPSKLPIVETITYSSSAPWLKGRPAWIADYATYYGTSRHFIARSMNGKPDYFTQKVFEGSQFNVFRKDKNIQFYLLVDLSLLKIGFYYVDLDSNERVLLKTYKIAAGRLDPSKPSGSLTPLGRYALGDKVAIYKAGVISYFQDQKREMIRFVGTRWIPFDQEGEHLPKGYGIYGACWETDPRTNQLIENQDCIGKYETDGGIRLRSEDLEELFAIVLTKPSFIEIVRDFREARLPGIEVATPTR